MRRVQILFTRAKFSLNFRFVEFILKMKNVNCVLEFLYRNGSKNPRELCERTGLSLATVYRKIGRIRNGESLEIRNGLLIRVVTALMQFRVSHLKCCVVKPRIYMAPTKQSGHLRQLN